MSKDNAGLAYPRWRPIKSAPLATHILVAVRGGEYLPVLVRGFKHRGKICWEIPESERVLAKAPTHWMPLPEPPLAERAKGGDA